MFATGGDYIGHGQYGCTFRPIIPCKSGEYIDPKSHGDIVKVGDKRSKLDIEAEVGEILSKFKVAKNYFALPKGKVCRPTKDIAKYEPEWKKCKKLVDNPKSITQMIQEPYVGVSWGDWRATHLNVETFDFFTFGQRLLEATALMTLAGIVHHDLHMENFLIDNDGIPRIIDFGFSFQTKKDHYEISDLYQFSVSYNQVPPEMSMWYAKWYKGKKTVTVQQAIDLTAAKRYALRIRRILLGRTVDADISDLNSYIHGSELFEKGDIDKWWNYNWTKFDAWSCGVILETILFELMRYSAFSRNRVASEKKDHMLAVIDKMLEVSPLKRIDAVEALNMWNPKSKIIELYGKSWLASRSLAL